MYTFLQNTNTECGYKENVNYRIWLGRAAASFVRFGNVLCNVCRIFYLIPATSLISAPSKCFKA